MFFEGFIAGILLAFVVLLLLNYFLRKFNPPSEVSKFNSPGEVPTFFSLESNHIKVTSETLGIVVRRVDEGGKPPEFLKFPIQEIVISPSFIEHGGPIHLVDCTLSDAAWDVAEGSEEVLMTGCTKF